MPRFHIPRWNFLDTYRKIFTEMSNSHPLRVLLSYLFATSSFLFSARFSWSCLSTSSWIASQKGALRRFLTCVMTSQNSAWTLRRFSFEACPVMISRTSLMSTSFCWVIAASWFWISTPASTAGGAKRVLFLKSPPTRITSFLAAEPLPFCFSTGSCAFSNCGVTTSMTQSSSAKLYEDVKDIIRSLSANKMEKQVNQENSHLQDARATCKMGHWALGN